MQNQLEKNAASGDVFIFLGKDLTKVKLLVWELSGFVLYYKRLEAGTFALPKAGEKSVNISYSDLCLLIEGVEVEVKYRRKRYSRHSEKEVAKG